MDIYNKIIIADYPVMDMEMKEISIHNYSYRAIETAIHVSIWNKDVSNKQVVLFTEADFVSMMTQKKEGEYLFPITGEALGKNGGDVNEAFEDEELDRDEIQKAVRYSGRINFRVSHIELAEYMYNNSSIPRKEAINILANTKKEYQLAPMPAQEDMLRQEAA